MESFVTPGEAAPYAALAERTDASDAVSDIAPNNIPILFRDLVTDGLRTFPPPLALRVPARLSTASNVDKPLAVDIALAFETNQVDNVAKGSLRSIR
jgi:hypothetical protein